MKAVVVAVALLALLAVACAEEKQQRDPNKYGWDNYGYSDKDSYSKESYHSYRRQQPYSKGAYGTRGDYGKRVEQAGYDKDGFDKDGYNQAGVYRYAQQVAPGAAAQQP